MRKVLVVAVLCVIVACLPQVAHAEELKVGHGSCDPCSIPYIMDVNQLEGNLYVATVEVAGCPYAFEATANGKKAYTHRVNRGVFAVKIRKNVEYTFKVKARGGKWKIVTYRMVTS